MNTVVAIVIHNRFTNLQTWIDCYDRSAGGAELVVIHNHYGDEQLRDKFHNYCTFNNIRYIGRNGPGFDIGAMQDVFAGRLVGMPDWDLLLWCCDDTLPMQRDFIQPFLLQMSDPTVGVAAMQISKSVAPHVRTTGFMIRRDVAAKIKFLADPVTTKGQCYQFEHRAGKNTFTNQVRAMGLDCVMVAPTAASPLWDSQHPNARLRLDRQAEFNEVWGLRPAGDKVVFVVPVLNMYPIILHSLLCQTHKNWELLLIHNGPLGDRVYDIPNDPRIKFIVHPVATGFWGHPLRRWALVNLDTLSDAEYVVISNADNYIVPTYCEYMLKGFGPQSKATFCSEMVHNYKAHQTIQCSLKVGFVDCGGVMVKREVAMEVGWRDIEGHSSDWTYISDIVSRYGAKSFTVVRGNLFTHN